MIAAVVDANVFMSAVLSPAGTPAMVLDCWRGGRFVLVLSTAILEEIYRVLHYPKIATRHRWPEEQIRAFVDALASQAMITPGALTLAVIEDDPADNRYLECAVEGEADFLVTGDQLLLNLGVYQGTQILTPRAFLDALQA
jgi:putative PIN family toxin of toxin-antitoxin system